VDFCAASWFPHAEGAGEHPAHDTRITRYHQLNFFEYECILEVRAPGRRSVQGRGRQIEAPSAEKFTGFTLKRPATNLHARGRKPEPAQVVRIDMSLRYIKRASVHRPNTRQTLTMSK